MIGGGGMPTQPAPDVHRTVASVSSTLDQVEPSTPTADATTTTAMALPVPPNPTLPAEYTPSFAADQVKVLGEKYTKEAFIQDLNTVITFWSEDAPHKMFTLFGVLTFTGFAFTTPMWKQP